jgi:L-ascorbate oxidase
MQTVWSFGDAIDIIGRNPEPYVTGYLQYGGSAYGNSTYDPLVNHFFPENMQSYQNSCPGWRHNQTGKN